MVDLLHNHILWNIVFLKTELFEIYIYINICSNSELGLPVPIDANMDVHGCAWGLKKGFKREEGYPTIET